MVEQIVTDLTNSKQKFDFGATPTICQIVDHLNEDLWQRDLEVWEQYTITMATLKLERYSFVWWSVTVSTCKVSNYFIQYILKIYTI